MLVFTTGTTHLAYRQKALTSSSSPAGASGRTGTEHDRPVIDRALPCREDPRATPSSRSCRPLLVAATTARRLTDWMMELHALRRARTEGEAERHDVSSDGRSNRHPSESRRVLVPSSASAQSARRATGKNPAFSFDAQVKSHVQGFLLSILESQSRFRELTFS